jgi:DNA-binding NarL/FixJ family response regulator
MEEIREEILEVFIVDDHTFYREGVRAMLERTVGVQVVGEAADCAEAVKKVLELQPDVVLMDVRMPSLDGISATRAIVAQSPHVRVLMVTMHEDDATVFSALKAGARGYVLKDSTRADLERAIFSVARGKPSFRREWPNECWGFSCNLIHPKSAGRCRWVPN